MRILMYLVIGLIVAIFVAAILPRKICALGAAVLLILGIAVPFGLWTYANHFVTGDPSSYGMLGTLCVIFFAPAGIALGILAMLKSD
jgi:hypothetical protein